MKIKLWEGGLHAHEVRAIETIEKTFSNSSTSPPKNNRGGTLKDQLSGLKGNEMLPWQGYAGFRFVDSRGNEGEFDLVIVTHCNVIIIELKDWNNGEITAQGDKWYKDNRDMGRSPVSVTRIKKFLLEKKLIPYKNDFSNKVRLPIVHFFVVMTGNSKFSKLSETELAHTISLNKFLEFLDVRKFDSYFRPHPESKVLNQDFDIFDRILLGNNTKPKHISVNGYIARELVFRHPKNVYLEYQAISEVSKQDEALLRIWDFNKISGQKAKTPEGRFEIASREREVLQYIKHHNHDLYNHCLRSLTSIQKDEITSEYSEVYELPPGHFRFNEFIGKYCEDFSENDRLNLAKLLVAKFADLHDMKVAHRDLGDHSIWIAASKEVALSNFISAYHQPAGTIGDFRSELSVSDGLFPQGMAVTEATTPFQMDVYSLGLLIWHILQAKRLSPSSIKSLNDDLETNSHWFSSVVKKALDGVSFNNARELFEDFCQSEPIKTENFDFDASELDMYRCNISHSRQFSEDDGFIVESNEKEIYISNSQLVKAWLNVNPTKDNAELGYKVLFFCQQIAKLKAISPPYIPPIRDFGIATRSSSLFLVTDIADGISWDELNVSSEQKFIIIERLIAAIEHLHGLHISHGDLHPGNVFVDTTQQELKVSLIDIPDFSIDADTTLNHKYSPENIDGCTAFERDNYAVMRMSIELLGLSWGGDSIEFPSLAEIVHIELDDTLYGFKDLGRFKDALTLKSTDSDVEIIEVAVKGDFGVKTIYPDNGNLYAQIEKSKKNPSQVRIRFIGIGGSLDAVYCTIQEQFTIGFPPRDGTSVRHADVENSQLEFGFALKIVASNYYDLQNLSNYLAKSEELKRATELALKPSESEDLSSETEIGLTETNKINSYINKPKDLGISTSSYWQAILDTEAESHPYIEVLGDVLIPKDQSDQLILPYKADIDPLGQFGSADVIEVFKVIEEKEVGLGVVNLKHSALNEVRLTNLKLSAKNIKDGDVLFFRTKQDKASYEKRKDALERILNKEGTISQLVDYFEPALALEAVKYDIDVTDSEFARYDRTDDHGNMISLNMQQRDAFKKLLKNGPLSMLQGPPGTGKTEFIAAFVHFLVEKQKVKNILLVSQSHEAVNTAAERIRKHCARLNTPLDVVRFSNREGAVSTGLKDVYSHSLIAEKRELFRAEARQRVSSVSKALGLEADYLSVLVSAELKLFKQIDQLDLFVNTLLDPKLDVEDQTEIKKYILDLDRSIRISLIEDYDFKYPENKNLLGVKSELLIKFASDFAVKPNEANRAQALAKIYSDMLDVLETDRVNYDEFLARSRQLITGTCVGIGQRHIGIQNNQYDWVIIDEAARSIASELAIAMQSGKRILLVGDHKQLPPLYSEPHKKAIARKLGIASKDDDIDSLLRSDFARAFESDYGKQTGAQLLTQYRMAPAIGNLISQSFYDEQLKNGERLIPDIYQNAPLAIRSVTTWLDTSKLGKFAEHSSDKGSSIYNRCECDQIMNLLHEIASNTEFVDDLSRLVKESEPAIGIICMYDEQKKLLKKRFNETVWSDSFKSLVKIDTVDSYQGKENRIVIVSITRNADNFSPGFLRSPNRINVALSRAMDRLLIVGAGEMWRVKNVNLPLGKVLKYIETKSNNTDYRILCAEVNQVKKGNGK